MTEQAQPTFFTVKYGENDQQLFNSDCSLILLVQSIKQHCTNQEYYEGLALISEQCEVINLSEHASSLENGKPLFTGRGMYILLALEDNGSGGLKYKPLIDSDYISQEMTDRLEELSNPENSQGRRKANSRRGYAQLTSSGSRKKSSVKSSKVRTPHK